jgi:hypothetical protein
MNFRPWKVLSFIGAATALTAIFATTVSGFPGRAVVAPSGPTVVVPSARAEAAPPPRYGGALDTDCTHVGIDPTSHGYQFITTCPGRALAPNGRFAVARLASEGGAFRLVDPRGGLLDEIPSLSDAMPIVLFWSPGSDWFFANHYLGSGQDRLQIFQVVNNRTVVERPSVFAEATREAVRRYPCLARHAMVVASGWRWSRNGRRIALVVYARPDSCHEEVRPGVWEQRGNWEVLWMIGDAETGQIDRASVRVRHDGVGPMPADGPYATL